MRVLVTGANRGIGAQMLADFQARGDTAMGTARTAKGELLPLDVTDPDQCGALAAKMAGQPLDLLVCNAGVYLDKNLPLDGLSDPAIWAQTFAANVTGVYLTAYAMLPLLKKATTPKIAIISSQMGSSTRAGGNAYIYRASKAAALNLGRNMAVELAPKGIAVGIYHPGWVRTDMGGASAAISVEQSSTGLLERFDALTLETTGCFEMYNGEAMPF